MGSGLSDLAVGCPPVVGVAPHLGGDAEVKAVASRVAAAGCEVLRQGAFAGLPGLLEGGGSVLQLADDLAGEGLVVLADAVPGAGHQEPTLTLAWRKSATSALRSV